MEWRMGAKKVDYNVRNLNNFTTLYYACRFKFSGIHVMNTELLARLRGESNSGKGWEVEAGNKLQQGTSNIHNLTSQYGRGFKTYS